MSQAQDHFQSKETRHSGSVCDSVVFQIQQSDKPPFLCKGKCRFLFNFCTFIFYYPHNLDKQKHRPLFKAVTNSVIAFYFIAVEKLKSACVPNILSQWLKCGAKLVLGF